MTDPRATAEPARTSTGTATTSSPPTWPERPKPARYEWRGEIPWKCQLPPGHKAPDGTFLGAQCRGNNPPATLTTAELDRLRRVERYAREVMGCLEKYGPSIVPHLMDDDDNSGEFLRRALNGASDGT